MNHGHIPPGEVMHDSIDSTAVLRAAIHSDTTHADETGTEREVIPPPSVSPDPDALERTRLGIPDELDERSLRADLWSELIHKASTAAELREELAVTRSELLNTQRVNWMSFASSSWITRRSEPTTRNTLESVRSPNMRRSDELHASDGLDSEAERADQERAMSRSERRKRRSGCRRCNKSITPRLDSPTSDSTCTTGVQPTSTHPATPPRPRCRINSTPSGTSVNSEIDYSQMTISGSVLNAAPNVRDIGVAFTFFDEHGNQVGAEIVQLKNARPNVPIRSQPSSRWH